MISLQQGEKLLQEFEIDCKYGRRSLLYVTNYSIAVEAPFAGMILHIDKKSVAGLTYSKNRCRLWWTENNGRFHLDFVCKKADQLSSLVMNHEVSMLPE